MRKAILILSAGLLLAACTEDPTIDLGGVSELKFDAVGGSQTVYVTSNDDWTVTVTATSDRDEWFTISPASGTEDGNFLVTVLQNESAYVRTATIAVTSVSDQYVYKTIALSQNPPVPPTDPESVSQLVRVGGGDIVLEAVEGYENVCAANVDWITVTPAADGDSFTLTFAENTTEAYRTGEVTLSTETGDLLKTATYEQSWRPFEPGEVLIEEIEFTGVELTTGSKNNYAQYFKITNNSDETLCFDGLMICESKYNNAADYTFPEPIKDEYCGVGTVYVIPGDGDDVPVAAGESIIVANNAQDHATDAKIGFDLSGADFEWYDETTRNLDVDNPDVPNLDKWFSYSNTFWTLHNRGFQSYMIALPPASVTSETFLADYAWEGTYILNASGTEMTIRSAYKVPNDWVIDGVNCCVTVKLVALAWGEAIDAGYTGVGVIDQDPDRYGKSVIRKRGTDGKLIDTNNSTNDFDRDQIASLAQ